MPIVEIPPQSAMTSFAVAQPDLAELGALAPTNRVTRAPDVARAPHPVELSVPTESTPESAGLVARA